VEIIEVGRWLAELDVTGRAAFDEKYGSPGGEFRLAAPGSTGIRERTLAIRTGGESDGSYNCGDKPTTGRMMLKTATEQKIVILATYLETLPIGSRVMWRNFDTAFPHDHDFKNENTVKIGPDVYAAHPFGDFPLQEVATQVGRGGYDDMKDLLEEIRRRGQTPQKDEEDQEQQAEDKRAVKYYNGIESREAYIAKFVRIVEIETFESQV
jgi:hypothetical protein